MLDDGAEFEYVVEEYLQLCRDGDSLASQGQLNEAIELYRNSFAAMPNAQALRGLGEAFAKQGQYQQAILHLSASVGMLPNPRVSYDLAEVLLKVGLSDEARKSLQTALAALPHFNKARLLLESFGQSDSQNRGESEPPAAV